MAISADTSPRSRARSACGCWSTIPTSGSTPKHGVEQVSFEDLLTTADIVVPLVVATPETTNLIDAAALARMKPTAFLINVSRGEVVDEAALEQALDRRAIAGAALDVGLDAFRMPPPRLAARDDVLATPHIGGVTPEAIRHQALETVRQVAAILARRHSAGRHQRRSSDPAARKALRRGPEPQPPRSSTIAPTDFPASTI